VCVCVSDLIDAEQMRPTAPTEKKVEDIRRKRTDQVGEVVSILSGHQPAGVTEAGDVLDVGLEARRVGFEHDVDERGQKVVR